MSLTTVEIKSFAGPESVEIIVADQPDLVQISRLDQPEVVYINQGLAGAAGAAGIGIPTGGTTGQALTKIDDTDYNTQWTSPQAIGGALLVAVKNGTTALTKGEVVYFTGAVGENILIGRSQANTEATSSKTIGFTNSSFAVNAQGNVITEGYLTGLNLASQGCVIGDPIWLSPTVAGGVIFGLTNKPSSPNHLVYLGIVKKIAGSKVTEIYVKVQNGFELQELHNVTIDAVGNPLAINDILICDNSTSNHGYWKNTPLSGVAVDLTSDQAIAGYKTFNDDVTIGAGILIQGNNWFIYDGTAYFTSLASQTASVLIDTDLEFTSGAILANGGGGGPVTWSISGSTGNATFSSIIFNSGNYNVSLIVNPSLTASQTYTLPDATGTIALTSGPQTFSGAQSFSSTARPTSSGTGTPAANSLITFDDAKSQLISQRSDYFSFFEDFDGVSPYGSNVDSGTNGGTVAFLYDSAHIGAIKITTAASAASWGRVRRLSNAWITVDSRAFDYCFIIRLSQLTNVTASFGSQNSVGYQTNIPTFYYTAAGTAGNWQIQHYTGTINTGYTATTGWVFLRMWRTATTGNINWEIRDSRTGTVRASGSSTMTMITTPYDFGATITAGTTSAVAFDIDYMSLYIPNLPR